MLIFTDLDGSLLDHETYSHAAAQPALDEIARRGIPLVLASSKTRLEMLVIQADLGLDTPFICENGAAVCEGGQAAGRVLHSFARGRADILMTLRRLRGDRGFQFAGFADWGVEEIASRTGLNETQAQLAAAREYSEPLLWQDSEARLQEFQCCLEDEQLVASQGGRFLSVTSPCDKGRALDWVRDRLSGDRAVTTVALGDSPNDIELLEAADIACIIRSARSEQIEVRSPSRVLRSQMRGPEGWQELMGKLLREESTDG